MTPCTAVCCLQHLILALLALAILTTLERHLRWQNTRRDLFRQLIQVRFALHITTVVRLRTGLTGWEGCCEDRICGVQCSAALTRSDQVYVWGSTLCGTKEKPNTRPMLMQPDDVTVSIFLGALPFYYYPHHFPHQTLSGKPYTVSVTQ